MKRLLLLLMMPLLGASAGESPYRPFSSRDGAVLVGSGLVGIASFLQSRTLQPLSAAEIAALDRDRINRFDRPAVDMNSVFAERWSDWSMRTALLLPAFFAFDRNVRRNGDRITLLYLETMLTAGAVTEAAKVSFRRIRPYAYRTDPAIEPLLPIDARKSFFSGHTSTAFAAAVFFAVIYSDYHPDSRLRPAVWAGALGLASSTAAARVLAGKHFPSDVLAAAVVGSAVGWGVPRLHRRLQNSASLVPLPPASIAFTFSF